MYYAKLCFKQQKDCVLDRLLGGVDDRIEIEIEEVSDDDVTFILDAGEHVSYFYDELDATDHVHHVDRLGEETLVVTKPSCGAYSTIYQNHGTLRRSNTIGPRQRIYNVMFFRREDLQNIIADMREIGTVSLIKLREAGDRSPELTDRQRTVASRALEAGYYEWPREIESEELASELDISRTTLHEHLRKAEKKILEQSLEAETSDSLAE